MSGQVPSYAADIHTKEELVTFHPVPPVSSVEGQLTVSYTLGSRVPANPLDWVGIFKNDNPSRSNPLASLWAPPEPICGTQPQERSLTFPAKLIQPLAHKPITYQCLYVTEDRRVLGETSPFKVKADVDDQNMRSEISQPGKSHASQSANQDIISYVTVSSELLSSDDEWEFASQSAIQNSTSLASELSLSDIVILSTSPSKEAVKMGVDLGVAEERREDCSHENVKLSKDIEEASMLQDDHPNLQLTSKSGTDPCQNDQDKSHPKLAALPDIRDKTHLKLADLQDVQDKANLKIAELPGGQDKTHLKLAELPVDYDENHTKLTAPLDGQDKTILKLAAFAANPHKVPFLESTKISPKTSNKRIQNDQKCNQATESKQRKKPTSKAAIKTKKRGMTSTTQSRSGYDTTEQTSTDSREEGSTHEERQARNTTTSYQVNLLEKNKQNRTNTEEHEPLDLLATSESDRSKNKQQKIKSKKHKQKNMKTTKELNEMAPHNFIINKDKLKSTEKTSKFDELKIVRRSKRQTMEFEEEDSDGESWTQKYIKCLKKKTREKKIKTSKLCGEEKAVKFEQEKGEILMTSKCELLKESILLESRTGHNLNESPCEAIEGGDNSHVKADTFFFGDLEIGSCEASECWKVKGKETKAREKCSRREERKKKIRATRRAGCVLKSCMEDVSCDDEEEEEKPHEETEQHEIAGISLASCPSTQGSTVSPAWLGPKRNSNEDELEKTEGVNITRDGDGQGCGRKPDLETTSEGRYCLSGRTQPEVMPDLMNVQPIISVDCTDRRAKRERVAASRSNRLSHLNFKSKNKFKFSCRDEIQRARTMKKWLLLNRARYGRLQQNVSIWDDDDIFSAVQHIKPIHHYVTFPESSNETPALKLPQSQRNEASNCFVSSASWVPGPDPRLVLFSEKSDPSVLQTMNAFSEVPDLAQSFSARNVVVGPANENRQIYEKFMGPANENRQIYDKVLGPANENRQINDKVLGPANENRQIYDTVVGPAIENRQIYDTVVGPANENRQIYDKVLGPANENRQIYDKVAGPANENRQIYDRVVRPANENRPSYASVVKQAVKEHHQQKPQATPQEHPRNPTRTASPFHQNSLDHPQDRRDSCIIEMRPEAGCPIRDDGLACTCYPRSPLTEQILVEQQEDSNDIGWFQKCKAEMFDGHPEVKFGNVVDVEFGHERNGEFGMEHDVEFINETDTKFGKKSVEKCGTEVDVKFGTESDLKLGTDFDVKFGTESGVILRTEVDVKYEKEVANRQIKMRLAGDLKQNKECKAEPGIIELSHRREGQFSERLLGQFKIPIPPEHRDGSNILSGGRFVYPKRKKELDPDVSLDWPLPDILTSSSGFGLRSSDVEALEDGSRWNIRSGELLEEGVQEVESHPEPYAVSSLDSVESMSKLLTNRDATNLSFCSEQATDFSSVDHMSSDVSIALAMSMEENRDLRNRMFPPMSDPPQKILEARLKYLDLNLQKHPLPETKTCRHKMADTGCQDKGKFKVVKHKRVPVERSSGLGRLLSRSSTETLRHKAKDKNGDLIVSELEGRIEAARTELRTLTRPLKINVKCQKLKLKINDERVKVRTRRTHDGYTKVNLDRDDAEGQNLDTFCEGSDVTPSVEAEAVVTESSDLLETRTPKEKSKEKTSVKRPSSVKARRRVTVMSPSNVNNITNESDNLPKEGITNTTCINSQGISSILKKSTSSVHQKWLEFEPHAVKIACPHTNPSLAVSNLSDTSATLQLAKQPITYTDSCLISDNDLSHKRVVRGCKTMSCPNLQQHFPSYDSPLNSQCSVFPTKFFPNKDRDELSTFHAKSYPESAHYQRKESPPRMEASEGSSREISYRSFIRNFMNPIFNPGSTNHRGQFVHPLIWEPTQKHAQDSELAWNDTLPNRQTCLSPSPEEHQQHLFVGNPCKRSDGRVKTPHNISMFSHSADSSVDESSSQIVVAPRKCEYIQSEPIHHDTVSDIPKGWTSPPMNLLDITRGSSQLSLSRFDRENHECSSALIRNRVKHESPTSPHESFPHAHGCNNCFLRHLLQADDHNNEQSSPNPDCPIHGRLGQDHLHQHDPHQQSDPFHHFNQYQIPWSPFEHWNCSATHSCHSTHNRLVDSTPYHLCPTEYIPTSTTWPHDSSFLQSTTYPYNNQHTGYPYNNQHTGYPYNNQHTGYPYNNQHPTYPTIPTIIRAPHSPYHYPKTNTNNQNSVLEFHLFPREDIDSTDDSQLYYCNRQIEEVPICHQITHN